ncbi:unnamed protein product [Mesocestoides corti]|uniref:OCRE domain-containing protein n=1 Tax=Mesocestoides corti TaxID=53468 RepID=A0A0R3U305_MESCO|nr:unnamed protein product [Mesocestoides corti]
MSRPRRQPPPREPNDEEKNIIVSVRHCARELDDILQGARRKAQASAQHFSDKTAPSLFRGLESYSDMYSKLKIKSRTALTRLFQRSRDLDDMVDAQEAIDETEECWRGFLANLDTEVKANSPRFSSSTPLKHVGDYIELSKPVLVDCSTLDECNLRQKLSGFTSALLIFQPAYLPDLAARCRSFEISKVMADFHRLNVGFVVITWGPEDVVQSWSKHLLKHIKWPVLWDRDNFFTSFLSFNRGCAALWAPEMLDFCAYQSIAYKRSIQPLPLDIDWRVWNWVGGEVLIASPAVSRLLHKRDMEAQAKQLAEGISGQNPDVSPPSKLPDTDTSSRICLIHRADNIAHMAPPGSIYQAALTCYAISQGKTEETVVEEIRMNRRLATPPESSRLQYERNARMYYDPETELYYDSRTGYFYDALKSTYYYWSENEHKYIPANDLVCAQEAAAHTARMAAAQAAAIRMVQEQEAAKSAAARVAAQLAALRAEKDEYASYAYATCVLGQEDVSGSSAVDPLASLHRTTGAAMEDSLKLIGGANQRSTSFTATPPPSDVLYPPGCTPPPGV